MKRSFIFPAKYKGEFLFVKIYIFLFLVLFPVTAFSGTPVDPVRTDFEILESIYSECIRAIITYPASEKGKPVIISFEGVVPEKKIHILTEAVLTAQDFSITEDDSNAGYRLTILIHEANITLQKKNREFSRNISLRLFAKCLDSTGAVLYAREIGKISADTISDSSRKATDTGRSFSNDIKRTVLGEKPGKLKIFSFLATTAALAYFGLK
jgi:hypothetical protein